MRRGAACIRFTRAAASPWMTRNRVCNRWLRPRPLVARFASTSSNRPERTIFARFLRLRTTAALPAGVGLGLALRAIVEGQPNGNTMSNRGSSEKQIESSKLHEAMNDEHGALMLEYSIVIGTVALAGAVGLLFVGIAVLNSFGFVRELLLSAIP